MPAKKLYVNISSEQDLITLLGSKIVENLRALGVEPNGVVLNEKDDEDLRSLLAKYNIPLLHVPYRRSSTCIALAGLIRRLRKLEYYRKSSFDSTLYAKSKMGYREGTHNLRKFALMKLVSKPLWFLRYLHPLVIRYYHSRIERLENLDAPVISLDYIHNDDHLELSLLCRRLGAPYITYVANLDQITNYDIHLDIPDRILVWGDFHKRVFTDRYGVAGSKIFKIGFCRSDRIAQTFNPGVGKTSVVYFCANTPANDPFLEENLSGIVNALEAKGAPYQLTLKKHPVNEKGIWERYQAALGSVSVNAGEVNLVVSTWEKYSKLDGSGLAQKDFSYRDLADLFASATHVFSATSTTTLEAAVAGVPAYFLNFGGKLDGCFRFEHMRILMKSGMVEIVTDESQLADIFSKAEGKVPADNLLLENIGTASGAFAACVDSALFPATKPSSFPLLDPNW